MDAINSAVMSHPVGSAAALGAVGGGVAGGLHGAVLGSAVGLLHHMLTKKKDRNSLGSDLGRGALFGGGIGAVGGAGVGALGMGALAAANPK
jgi:hypothetical protein